MHHDTKPLRKGLTTGVHAVLVFFKALEGYLYAQQPCRSTTRKIDNDDLDVTRGAQISATVSSQYHDLTLNPIAHQPYTMGTLKLYAGSGVGVVTREGLKPPKDHPAINPVPLSAIANIYRRLCSQCTAPVYAAISVTDGETIARQTANAKVGVLGGISILGTTGWVKPISAAAYRDAIASEIGFAVAQHYDTIVLTLGNSALKYARKHYAPGQIIEIGNFVYDAIRIAQASGSKRIHFVCGVAKAVKVAQGHRNTHNRFGCIDWEALTDGIARHIGVRVETAHTATVRGVVDQLDRLEKKASMLAWVTRICNERLSTWFPPLHITTRIV